MKNFDFDHDFRKISILVKIFEKFRFLKLSKNLDFFGNFDKIFSKKIAFRQNLRQDAFSFWKFRKIRFWSNFRKILILVKIYEKHRFFRKFGKFRFCQIFKKNIILVKIGKNVENFDLDQISEKFGFVQIFQISILVKISKYFDFGENFW